MGLWSQAIASIGWQGGRAVTRSAPTGALSGPSSAGERSPSGRRLLFAFGFAAITVSACVLLGRRFTHTSWPLQRAHMSFVAGAIGLYFSSYVLRALGWQKLFP